MLSFTCVLLIHLGQVRTLIGSPAKRKLVDGNIRVASFGHLSQICIHNKIVYASDGNFIRKFSLPILQ